MGRLTSNKKYMMTRKVDANPTNIRIFRVVSSCGGSVSPGLAAAAAAAAALSGGAPNARCRSASVPRKLPARIAPMARTRNPKADQSIGAYLQCTVSNLDTTKRRRTYANQNKMDERANADPTLIHESGDAGGGERDGAGMTRQFGNHVEVI